MSIKQVLVRPALIVSAFTLLVAAFVSLIFTETAAIKIAVPPQRLESNVTLSGRGATSVAVQHVDAEVTDMAQGTASTITIAPAYARGFARFLYTCPAIGCPLPFTLPAGTVLATVRESHRYSTQSSATFELGSGQEQTVPIRAIVSGAASNVGPASITLIDNNPRAPFLNVVNLLGVSGGVDGGTVPVIQQSDINAVRAALESRVTNELGPAMIAQTQGMTFIVDGPPAIEFRSDHAVGDQVPTFTLTMIGKTGARAFSNDSAQAILRAELQPRVLPGYGLADPIKANYRFVQQASSTDLVITADAVGYAVPQTSTAAIRSRLAGLGLPHAYSRLRHDFPGSSIEIRTKPLPIPWLPLVSNHIDITVMVEPTSD